MSITAILRTGDEAYEGKVHVAGIHASYFAATQLFFGKAVVANDPTVTARASQKVKSPITTELAGMSAVGGVVMADTSVERLAGTTGIPNEAAFGAYSANQMVNVMRQGQIWVVVDTALASTSGAVFIRIDVAGGTPPTEALGSFDTVDTGAEHEPAVAGMRFIAAAVSADGTDLALLDINLPATL